MALPEPLMLQALTISELFGGTEVLKKRLTEEQMVRILLYPGDVVITRPWTEEDHVHDEHHICSGTVCVDPDCVDPACTCVTGICVCAAMPEAPVILNLRNYGMVGSRYKVFNSEMQYLYSGYNERGEFGPDPRDLELLLRTPHASTAYVSFETQYAEKIILLWCCSEISEQERRAYIGQQLYLREAASLEAKAHELYAQTLNIRQEGRIVVYFLPQPWQPLVSLENIKSNPLTEAVSYPADQELALLNLQRSGWFLFEQWIGGQVNRILTLEEPVGSGARRLRKTAQNLYYLDLTNVALRPSGLPSSSAFGAAQPGSSWSEMDTYLRLETTFRYT
jgi:hypothetical protein